MPIAISALILAATLAPAAPRPLVAQATTIAATSARLAPNYVGTFTGTMEGQRIEMVVQRDGDSDRYTGTVKVGDDKSTAFTAVLSDKGLEGKSAEKDSDTFLAVLNGDTLKIDADGNTLTLTRASSAPAPTTPTTPTVPAGTDPFPGTYTGKEVEEALVLTLRADGDRYTGTIAVGNQLLELTATRQADGSLAGNLNDKGHEGKGDAFVLTIDGDTLTLSDPRKNGKPPLKFTRGKAASSGAMRQVFREHRIAFAYPDGYTITKGKEAKTLTFTPDAAGKLTFVLGAPSAKAPAILAAMRKGDQPDPIVEHMLKDCAGKIAGAKPAENIDLGKGGEAVIMRLTGKDDTAAVILAKAINTKEENADHDLVLVSACGPKDQLEAFLPTLRRMLETFQDRDDADGDRFVQEVMKGTFDLK